MAKVSPIQTNFTAGEFSPLLDGRVDISRYYNSAKTLENFIILPQGGIRRRPGTYYVASTKSNGIARLIAFQFSTTQSYILEFGNLYIRVYKDNGQVQSGGNPYELVTPYAEADLFDLQFAQDADTMWIVHPTYKPRKLTRTAHDNWTIGNYAPTADSFTSADNYPSCVAFFEQRIVFANTNTDPQKVWASVSGNYEDMTTGSGDSAAFVYTLGTEQVNAIRWLSSGKVLLMGTLGGIFSMSSGSNQDPVTPTNVTVKRESTYGSVNIVPKKIGNYVYFLQRNLKTIRETVYSYDDDEYQAKDMMILAPHIAGSGIVDMDYQQSPYNILWCIRSDGEIATLTREIENEVIAWSRQVLGGSFTSIASGQAVAESVAVIPGDGEDDEVWFVVKRTINGSTVRYIEYLKSMDFGSEQEDAFFVDAGLTLDSPKTITGITKANPGVVTAASHGFSNNDIVIIRNVIGMTEVNRNKYKVANKTTNTFELNEAGTGLLSSDKFLLHMDGTDGSTDIIDSMGNHTIIANGGAEIDTDYSKFGGASCKFNGTTAYLSILDHADWDFLQGNFGIGFWVRFNTVATYAMFLSQYQGGDDWWAIQMDSNTLKLNERSTVGGAHWSALYYCSWTPSVLTWYHIEINRSGNTLYMLINGVLQSVTTSVAWNNQNYITGVLNIGGANSIGNYFDGWTDEVRFSKGAALHTAAFTPPAAPYVIGVNVDTTDFGTYISGGEARECVTSLSSLDHLEGETLDIFIDGIERTQVSVASGAISITDPENGGGEIHTGLPCPPTLKTMRVEAGSQQGTAQSKLKRVNKIFAMINNTIGMNAGNEDTQDPIEFDQANDFIAMYSGWQEIPMPSSWDRDGYIVITGDGPKPLTILNIVSYLTTSDA